MEKSNGETITDKVMWKNFVEVINLNMQVTYYLFAQEPWKHIHRNVCASLFIVIHIWKWSLSVNRKVTQWMVRYL